MSLRRVLPPRLASALGVEVPLTGRCSAAPGRWFRESTASERRWVSPGCPCLAEAAAPVRLGSFVAPWASPTRSRSLPLGCGSAPAFGVRPGLGLVRRARQRQQGTESSRAHLLCRAPLRQLRPPPAQCWQIGLGRRSLSLSLSRRRALRRPPARCVGVFGGHTLNRGSGPAA